MEYITKKTCNYKVKQTRLIRLLFVDLELSASVHHKPEFFRRIHGSGHTSWHRAVQHGEGYGVQHVLYTVPEATSQAEVVAAQQMGEVEEEVLLVVHS